MKKLIFRLFLFAPIMLIIMTVNFFIDPANIFSGDSYINGIAQIMLSGKNVAGVQNYDERLLQKRYIEGLQKPKDIVVIGSSRSMQISSQLFQGKTLINNSVSIATLEDFLAIHHLYFVNGKLPSTIVLGIDPWIFNSSYNYDLWETLSDEYHREMVNLGLEVNKNIFGSLNLIFLEKIGQIVSPHYFQNSIKQWLSHGWVRPLYYSTDKTESNVPIKVSDGSYSYPDDYRLVSVEDVRQRINNVIGQPIDFGFEHYSVLDSKRELIFIKFIDLLKREKINLIIFLPPYHPLFFDFLIQSGKQQILSKAQNFLISVADSNDIQIIGSYNPNDIPCQENEFYDYHHPTDICIERIFRKIK